ncbi:MAG TPA: RDD family protein [Candidatus Methylacidiphilales bacterium]|nr:RDD family protein [Candidatus Methylacidiphilales bacterium]
MADQTWDARKTELELPEEIDLQIEVANVGSRTLAILIDLACCALLLFGGYVAASMVIRNQEADWISRFSSAAITTLFLLLIFGVQWGYFNFFEWFWNGQTPGKRLLHLRVIKADGTPVSLIDVLLRNLSRPIDTFGPMGLIGLLMIFVSRHAQRLGDLMARTLVIHETPIDWSIFDVIDAGAASPQGSAAPSLRLSPAQWELLQRYLSRRAHLQPEIRARLAVSIQENLKSLARGTDLERSVLPPEEWLLELARRV